MKVLLLLLSWILAAASAFCKHGSFARSSLLHQPINEAQIPSTFLRKKDNSQITPPSIFMANSDDDDKFSFGQRIESLKSVVVGALAGGICLAPFSALHDIFLGGNGVTQWEFDTDMGSLEAALFAIVYRYAVRNDENEMLNMGVVGAFCLTRTLSRVTLPGYCSAAPLDCGAPLGYFDWDMLRQVALSGVESLALFGAAAAAMDYCFDRNFISKFP